jgi:hypothetical protein
MKKGDIVEVVPNPEIDWMEQYANRLFEVKEVYERRCLVRMLNVTNQERYWFSEKENFRMAELEIVEIEENET